MATERDGFPYNAGTKIRGYRAYDLVRELASGTLSQRKLATKYGVQLTTIVDFKRRNADRIAAVAADMENRMAGLWVADKERRIAEYQQDIALLNDSSDAVTAAREVLSGPDAEGDELSIAKLDRDLGAILKRKHAALRNVAEELGQLPNRMNVQISGGETPVLHQIVGVDPDDV